MSMGESRTLRFGVMCSGTTFPAWQAKCLRELLALDFVSAALLIVSEREPVHRLRSMRERIRRGNLLWTLYSRYLVDRWSQAMSPVDMSKELSGIPLIQCRTLRRDRYSQHFTDEDVRTIREYGLDFILRFSFGIIRGEVLSSARFGIWSFHHGDEQKYRGAPPCFWEIYDGDAVTGSMLQRLTDQLDAGVVLHKGFFRTIDHSYVRNRDQAFFGSGEWPAQVCKDVYSDVAAYLDAPPSASIAPLRRNPTARQVIRFLLRLGRNLVRNQIRSMLRHDQWNVGIVDRPIHRLLDEDLDGVRWLPAPQRGRYLADPFGLIRGSSLVILAEDFDYRTNRGRISWVEANGAGVSEPRVALELAAHGSYPYLFQHLGDIYCVPETAQSRRVDLFRATAFPAEWEHVTCLLDGLAALDPTVFRHGGLWWLFCCEDDLGRDARLLAFYADDLQGPWKPHSANPIKTDIRSSRPGGTPFEHEGVLYRPAQDASLTYGGALVLNRIRRLTPTEFSEEAVRGLRPDPKGPYPHGVHTISSAGSVTLIDAKRRVFVPSRMRREISARVRTRLRGERAHV
jgi:hypothetical protein